MKQQVNSTGNSAIIASTNLPHPCKLLLTQITKRG